MLFFIVWVLSHATDTFISTFTRLCFRSLVGSTELNLAERRAQKGKQFIGLCMLRTKRKRKLKLMFIIYLILYIYL